MLLQPDETCEFLRNVSALARDVASERRIKLLCLLVECGIVELVQKKQLDSALRRHVACIRPSLIEIGSKTAEKNSSQTNRQTNKQTDSTKIMVTWT